METKKTANKDLNKAKGKANIIKRNIEAAKLPRNKSKENKKPVVDKKPLRAKSQKNLKEKQSKPVKNEDPVDILDIKSPMPIRNSPEKSKSGNSENKTGKTEEKVENFEIKIDSVPDQLFSHTERIKEGGEKTPVRQESEIKVMPKASSAKRRRDSNEDIEGIEKTIKTPSN